MLEYSIGEILSYKYVIRAWHGCTPEEKLYGINFLKIVEKEYSTRLSPKRPVTTYKIVACDKDGSNERTVLGCPQYVTENHISAYYTKELS